MEHYACLKVTYLNGLQCCYESTLREEVGPMGHYEDRDLVLKMELSETEFKFSNREELIGRIMAFVPRTKRLPGKPPAEWHAIELSTLPDETLRALLSVCFR